MPTDTISRVEDFDQSEAGWERENPAAIAGRLFAARRDVFVPLQLANRLLDACTLAISRPGDCMRLVIHIVKIRNEGANTV